MAFSKEYYRKACNYLQGHDISDNDNIVNPNYITYFSKNDIYEKYKELMGISPVDLKTSIIFLAHYYYLCYNINNLIIYYPNGCGRISDFYTGYETLLCDKMYPLSDKCDCNEKDNWSTIVLSLDLLTKPFLDLKITHEIQLYEPIYINDSTKFTSICVRDTFDLNFGNGDREHIYYLNMNYPKSTNVKISPYHAYSWEDSNFPETNLSFIKSNEGYNGYIKLERVIF